MFCFNGITCKFIEILLDISMRFKGSSKSELEDHDETNAKSDSPGGYRNRSTDAYPSVCEENDLAPVHMA